MHSFHLHSFISALKMNAGIEMLGTQKLFLVNSVLSISFKKEEIT